MSFGCWVDSPVSTKSLAARSTAVQLPAASLTRTKRVECAGGVGMVKVSVADVPVLAGTVIGLPLPGPGSVKQLDSALGVHGAMKYSACAMLDWTPPEMGSCVLMVTVTVFVVCVVVAESMIGGVLSRVRA